eukprot:CAMPEP_0173433918 /NCGR_PEP_ID=MMETSP1357-20121228/11181_1 /TAXON_ID=77926 /ORGANISM="Hemiselmis rufescens, Strain PCC563" /LENGTH=437 /DNA_ID=CAMNT_0014398663 /DNA_START=32 /DNA_END=1342 /DNA_ORIENTATION=+
MARLVLAAGAGALGCIGVYSLYTGKGLGEVVEELRGALGLGVPELEPGSMAFSASSIEGVPEMRLGAEDGKESLFKARAQKGGNYRPGPVLTDVGGVPITDDVAVPGSLAVTCATLDGKTPTLALGTSHFNNDDDEGAVISPASIFVRRSSSKKFAVEAPPVVMSATATALNLNNKTPTMALPTDPPESPTHAVPTTPGGSSLFERRKLKLTKPESYGASSSPQSEVDVVPHGGVSMAASASLTHGDEAVVCLSGTKGPTSLLARRQASMGKLTGGPSIAKPPTSDSMDSVEAEEQPTESELLTMAYTAMTQSPTMKLGGADRGLFMRRKSKATSSLLSPKGEGNISKEDAEARARGEHFRVGVLRSEYSLIEELIAGARESLSAREADFEAMDESIPKEAAQARAWHTKQVEEARIKVKELEGRLEECGARLRKAE